MVTGGEDSEDEQHEGGRRGQHQPGQGPFHTEQRKHGVDAQRHEDVEEHGEAGRQHEGAAAGGDHLVGEAAQQQDGRGEEQPQADRSEQEGGDAGQRLDGAGGAEAQQDAEPSAQPGGGFIFLPSGTRAPPAG